MSEALEEKSSAPEERGERRSSSLGRASMIDTQGAIAKMIKEEPDLVILMAFSIWAHDEGGKPYTQSEGGPPALQPYPVNSGKSGNTPTREQQDSAKKEAAQVKEERIEKRHAMARRRYVKFLCLGLLRDPGHAWIAADWMDSSGFYLGHGEHQEVS